MMRDTFRKRVEAAERLSMGDDGSVKILILYADNPDPAGFERDARERYSRGGYFIVRMSEIDRGLL